jgi:neopullulanase
LVTFLGLHDVPRFMQESGGTIDSLKLAFTFLLTTRGIPLVYYGDEIAMRGGADPDNRRDFPGGFPGDASNAFDRAGRTPEQQEVFEYVRRLIHIRQQTEPLRIGALRELAIGDQTYVYARQTAKNSAVIFLNNGDRPATMKVGLAAVGLRDGVTLSDHLGAGLNVDVANGAVKLQMAPHSAALLLPRP